MKLTKQESNKAATVVDANNELRIDTAILIQDPFKLSHNVSQNLSANGMTIFLDFFKKIGNLQNLNDENSFSLIKLFTRTVDTGKHPRKKRKRNRSSVYTITLPNCNHVSDGSLYCCYDRVKAILTEDLHMQLIKTDNEEQSQASLCFQNKEVDKAMCVFSNNGASVPVEVSQTDNIANKKRKYSTDECEADTKNKRVKTELPECIDFIACAYTDTWTNRRKQRRLLHNIRHGKEMQYGIPSNENDDSGVKMSDSSDIPSNRNDDSGVKMSDSSDIPSNRNDDSAVKMSDSSDIPSNGNDDSGAKIGDSCVVNVAPEIRIIKAPECPELLRFNVVITKAKDNNDVCKVMLDLVDNSKNIQDFQTFFAYFKKEIVTIFK